MEQKERIKRMDERANKPEVFFNLDPDKIKTLEDLKIIVCALYYHPISTHASYFDDVEKYLKKL